MIDVYLDRIHSTKPASGIAFITAYCHEVITQQVRVFTFETVVADATMYDDLVTVAEDAGYNVVDVPT